MSVDDLINKALKGGGGMLDTSNMFAIIGEIGTNELFVLNLQDFFAENLICFSEGKQTAAILLGAYVTEDLARKCIENIREDQLQGPGLVVAPDWHILMANPEKNELFSILLTDYYISCLAFYSYQVKYDILPIGILENKDAADAAIDIIKYTIRSRNF